MKDRIYRLSDVIQRIGVSRSTIYNLIAAQTFPAPKRLGKRILVWSESDVESWLNTQLSKSEHDQPQTLIAKVILDEN